MKQNKKAKICFVIYIAGFFLKKFCYEVFAKQKKKKRAEHYYFSSPTSSSPCDHKLCHNANQRWPQRSLQRVSFLLY